MKKEPLCPLSRKSDFYILSTSFLLPSCLCLYVELLLETCNTTKIIKRSCYFQSIFPRREVIWKLEFVQNCFPFS